MNEKLKTPTELFTLKFINDCNNAELGSSIINSAASNKPNNLNWGILQTFKNGSIGGGLPTNIQILTYCDNNNNTYTKTRSKIGNNSYSEWK